MVTKLDHQSLLSRFLSYLSSFALSCRPAGAPYSPSPNKSLIFYTITSRSLPAHGWVQVSLRLPAHCVLILGPLFSVTNVQWAESLSH